MGSKTSKTETELETDLRYKSEQWLREQYLTQKKSVTEIADKTEVTYQTIYDWMDKYGIERDATRYGEKSRVQYATYYVGPSGYARWQSKYRDKNGERQTENYSVHRLLAISEYGTDAVIGMDVHHKNGIRWDNRPENIEIIDHAEHRRIHAIEEETWKDHFWHAVGDDNPGLQKTKVDESSPEKPEQSTVTLGDFE
jgi:hypothetical protein